jgi:hypothetical protein
VHCIPKNDNLTRENLGQIMNVLKHSFLGVALVGLVLLPGCASDENPPGQTFTYNGNSWVVSDIRGEDRLVITAVNPRLAGLGTEAAARHPVMTMPEAEYRAAAQGWLTTTGRFCTPGPAQPAGDSDEDAPSGYQYQYSCWNPA